MASILDKIVARKKLDIAAAQQNVSLERLQDQLPTAPPVRDFLTAIQFEPGVSLIAEVKKASPSKGVIRADFDPVSIARSYEIAGATCISVLTDEPFFQGHLDYLRDIRKQAGIPLLRKDFIIDTYQVVEARVAGADAVLLIAECLESKRLKELHDQIVALGMTPLVEFYDPQNLESVLNCGAQLVGVNNRDLNSFETDLNHCIHMRRQIPSDITMVGESGIFCPKDVAMLACAGIDAMLVGESLMRSEDIGQAVASLLS